MRALAFLTLAAVALTGGCIRSFDPPHDVAISGLALRPALVMTQDVLLNVTTTLDARGVGEAKDLRLRARAFSEDTGFLVAENESLVGSLSGDATRSVSMLVKVPRAGAIRIDVELDEGAVRHGAASIGARNLGTLEPAVLDTGLRVGDVDFLVRNATGGRATIQTDLYVTNEGATGSEDLRVQVKAREVTTRLVADNQWLDTGAIAPGATVVRSVNLTVPDKYNYAFEILTWRGDAIVARTSGNVQLAPTFEKPNNTELVVTQPNLNQFISATPVADSEGLMNGPAYASSPYGAPPSATPSAKVPGFGALAGLAAAGVAALALGRWRK